MINRQSDYQTTGTHVLLDMWNCVNLSNAEILQALEAAAAEARCEVVHTHVHRFPKGGGVTGFALLAESHIAVHSWPEHGYASADIYTCGAGSTEKAADSLRLAFGGTRCEVRVYTRGSGRVLQLG